MTIEFMKAHEKYIPVLAGKLPAEKLLMYKTEK
jgi:hypothetical protein